MGSNQNHLQIIKNYISAYNTFDIERMLQDFNDEIYFENVHNGQVNLQTSGIAEFKKQAEIAKTLFKEREQKIIDIKFEDNMAQVRIDFTAILSDDPANGSQAGAALNMSGDSVFVFEDGKIVQITDRS